MSDLPRYVKVKNGKNLAYQRRIPSHIQRQTQCNPQYHVSLNLDITASPTEIHDAVGKAHEDYDVVVKMLSKTSAEAYSQTEIDIAANKLLQDIKRKPAEFAWLKDEVVESKGLFTDETITKTITKKDIAEFAVTGKPSGLEDLEGKLSIQDTVKKRAIEKLIEQVNLKAETYSALLQEYIDAKGFEKKKGVNQEKVRNNLKILKRLRRIESMVGDNFITKDSGRIISSALKAYRNERQEVVKHASIKRELTDINGFFRWLDKEKLYKDLDITIPTLEIPAPEPKKVLSWKEQYELFDFILSPEIDKLKDRWKIGATLVTIYIQGGLMASELKRMDNDKIVLDGKYPHLIVYGETKTEERKRLIPIVIGLDLIKKNIKLVKDYLESTSCSTASYLVKDFFKQIVGIDRTAHCLRHTFEHNVTSNEVEMASAVPIAGWSGGKVKASPNALKYGASGKEHEEIISALTKTSRKIHRHLLNREDDKVVKLFPNQGTPTG